MRLRPEMPNTYAARTYDSPYWPIRYAHRKRYELVRDVTLETHPEVVLDYGAGACELFFSILGDPSCSPTMRAIAHDPWWTDEVKRVLAEHPQPELSARIEVSVSQREVADNECDVVVCGGVLEHITLGQRYDFYEFASRILKPGGRVVVDVPVELGPAVLIKNFGRRVLKSYPSEYTMRELLSAGFGMTVFDPHRFDPRASHDAFFESHKGFDHRLLAQEMREWGFKIERKVNSPVPWIPANLANQEVILVATL
jgi:predicted SAM-dependent methyltransferase